MVCWSAGDVEGLEMAAEVKRAKKCKVGSHSSQHNDLRCTPLQPFSHQVGGHTLFLQLDQSTVCKALIPRELSFYQNAPPEVRAFIPTYKGVAQTRTDDSRPLLRIYDPEQVSVQTEVQSAANSKQDAPLRICLAENEVTVHQPAQPFSDGSSQFFLMLENVASRFRRPCVLDLKMGTRQHGDDATAEKRNRQMAKCAASTSASLGVRLCGMQVYQATSDSFWSQDKYYGRHLDAAGLRRALIQFFAGGGSRRSLIIDLVIDKLRQLRKAVEKQDTFRFYSSSLLVVYEGCEDPSPEIPLSTKPRFHSTSRSSSGSDCVLEQGKSCPPLRSSSDIQIPGRSQKRNASDDMDLDSLSITNSTDFNTDETRSFSSSPLSIDSGMECLENLEKRSQPGANRSSAFDCENSTDSSDSGLDLAARPPFHRTVDADAEDTEHDFEMSENELEHSSSGLSLVLESNRSSSVHFVAEDEGELTPVVDQDHFMEDMFEDFQTPKRRVSWSDLADVRMIDFAHTTFCGYLADSLVHWGPDSGYLLGLDSLTKILTDIRITSL